MFPYLTLGAMGDRILNKQGFEIWKYVSFRKQGSNRCMVLPVARWFWPQDVDLVYPWPWKSMAKLLRFQLKIHNFLSLCPPTQISTVVAMTPQLTLGTRISGGHRPEIKKNGFQNAYFFRSYFPIQNTCNWVSHSAIAYAYGSKMWRASSPIVSRNVRKHRACIKQRNLQWRCGVCGGVTCTLTKLMRREKRKKSSMTCFTEYI